MARANQKPEITIINAHVFIDDIGSPNLWLEDMTLDDWEEYDKIHVSRSELVKAARNNAQNSEIDLGYEKGHWKNGLIVFFNKEEVETISEIASEMVMAHGTRPTVHKAVNCPKEFCLIDRGYAC